MGESPCTEESSDVLAKAETAAIEMYRFAALMLGDEAEALTLVEKTVAGVEIDPCADPCKAKGLVRDRVLDGALAIMHRQDPGSFTHLPAADPTSRCLDDDGAPLSSAEINDLVAGPGRGPLRDWLAHLSQAQRAVFLQRAVLGSTNADTAHALNRHTRPSLWTAEAVSSLFRQVLCSLATSLLHSAHAVQI